MSTSSRNLPSLLGLILAILLPTLCLAVDPPLRAIHFEGVPADKRAWLMESFGHDKPENAYTLVWQRSEGSPLWEPEPNIPFQVVQVTHFADTPVVLLRDGQWILLGQSTGPSLPGRGKILALAGNDASLWSIGDLVDTAPTSRPTTGPTALTTQPVVQGLGLFQYSNGAWRSYGLLPSQIATANPILGIVRGRPVAATASGGSLKLWRYGTDNIWSPLGEHQIDEHLQPQRLLEDSTRAVVFLAGPKGPAQLLVWGTNSLQPIALTGDATIRNFGVAGEMFRYIYAERDEIKERRISPRTLQVEGSDQTVILPRVWDLSQVYAQIQFIDMALIILIMVNTYRNREQYQNTKINWKKLQVCPVGRRLFAAMIDLAPVLGMLIYIRFNIPRVETFSDVFIIRDAFILYGVSIITYLAHTTLVECILGRSLGKILGRLEIVGVDGQPPSRKALLIRNLLRIIDVTLMFTPILAIYLPLHQRLGDLGAGTVVVCDREEPAPDSEM